MARSRLKTDRSTGRHPEPVTVSPIPFEPASAPPLLSAPPAVVPAARRYHAGQNDPTAQMPFRPLPVPAPIAGAVWLHSMPGRLERWDAFLAEAQRNRVSLIVCLTPRHELASLSPAYAAALREGTLAMRWLALPMRDFGLADNLREFRAGIVSVAEAVRTGDSALLHCAAGIGRTGTAAACLLKHLGVQRELALQQVLAAGSNPESAAQAGLINSF